MRMGLCCIILARRYAFSVSTSDSCTERLVGERRIMAGRCDKEEGCGVLMTRCVQLGLSLNFGALFGATISCDNFRGDFQRI